MASNPMLNERAFERAKENAYNITQVMTLQGTINKTFFLLFLCVVGGMITWTNYESWANSLLFIMIGAVVLGFVTIFKPNVSPVTAPIYAFLEGLLLGTISARYNVEFNGIVLNAVAITILVFFIMLVIYRSGLIPVTRGLRIAIISATVAITLFYIASWLLALFGFIPLDHVAYSSPLSIGISVVICIVAAFNFLLDFDFINKMTDIEVAPKYMEWYAGFGLLLTIIWLYLEVLRLLAKTQRR